jgi:hypothetical protein
MGIGVKGSRYGVFGGEPVQKRHRGIADDATEVLVFFDDDEDVIEARHLRAGSHGAEQQRAQGENPDSHWLGTS